MTSAKKRCDTDTTGAAANDGLWRRRQPTLRDAAKIRFIMVPQDGSDTFLEVSDSMVTQENHLFFGGSKKRSSLDVRVPRGFSF